jgi:hypothetical protein
MRRVGITDHFRLLETSRKVVLRRVPKLVKAVMMAIAISDAMRAYSMAVAPDSLAINALMRSVMISFQAPAPSSRRSWTARKLDREILRTT